MRTIYLFSNSLKRLNSTSASNTNRLHQNRCKR